MLDRTELMISMFGNYSKYRAESSVIMALMKTFPGYIPSAQPVSGGTFPGVFNQPTVFMTHEESGDKIGFTQNRIDLILRPNKEFVISQYEEVVKKIIEDSGGQANRIALNVQWLFHGLTDSEMQEFNKLATSRISYYDDNLDEWNVRFVRKIDFDMCGKTEKVNVGTQISTMAGVMINTNMPSMPPTPANAYTIAYDINTLAENAIPRFGHNDIIEFTQQAENVVQEINENLAVE